MKIPDRLIIRAHAPVRRRLLLGLVLLIVALALGLIYQLGRYQAGREARLATAQRETLLRQIAQLQSQAQQMRVQIAAAQEGRVAQLREREEVARTIGDLQVQVANQQQQIEFYRGLIPQGGQNSANATVRVQQFRVTALPGPQHYAVRFTLSRLTKPDETLSGTMTLTVEGTRNAAAASVDLATIGDGQRAEVPFSFKYYSEIEQDIRLPAGFQPSRITLTVRPGRAAVAPYRQTFAWAVDPA